MCNCECKTYNVCAYQNRERILKEMVEVPTAKDAIAIGKTVLRGNGFTSLKGVKFEAVLLD
jgi:hypothetical protein